MLQARASSRLAFVLLTLSACASAPIASPSLTASARSFSPSDGMARVYVVRPSNLFGAANLTYPILDGRLVGATASGTFVMIEIPPGTHTIRAGGQGDAQQFEAIAGQCYFFEIHATWGGAGHAAVEPMESSRGRGLVERYEMAAPG